MKRLFVIFYLIYWLSVENSCLGEGQASSLKEKLRCNNSIIGQSPDIFHPAEALEDHLHIICISIIYLKKTDSSQLKTTHRFYGLIHSHEFIILLIYACCVAYTIFEQLWEKRALSGRKTKDPYGIGQWSECSALLIFHHHLSYTEMCPLTLLLTQLASSWTESELVVHIS